MPPSNCAEEHKHNHVRVHSGGSDIDGILACECGNVIDERKRRECDAEGSYLDSARYASFSQAVKMAYWEKGGMLTDGQLEPVMEAAYAVSRGGRGKACDPKPFTLDGVLGEFDEKMADAFWLHPDDKMGQEANSSRIKSFIAQHFKSFFSELMEAVPEQHKMKPNNMSGQMFEAAHNSFRSALLAKGREMGLGE
jgi:hypothetical protein